MAMQNRIAEQFETVSEQVEETIGSYPLATVAAAFGLGLIIGVAVVASCQSERPSQHMSDRLGNRLRDLLAQMTAHAKG